MSALARLFPGRKAGAKTPVRPAQALVTDAGARDEPPIGVEIHTPGIRWDMLFAFFLRLMGAVWLLRGLSYWALILGMGDVALHDESRLRQALVIAFALLDCVAGVGIWLNSPWGKSLWIFLLVCEAALGFSGLSGLVSQRTALSSASVMVMFFVLAYAVRARYRGKI
ncbi:MAG: hypothetical protein LCH38_06535 [Proteobacteria bacterium]|nr:hypothetical protein [Pseudomonadota bacterium]